MAQSLVQEYPHATGVAEKKKEKKRKERKGKGREGKEREGKGRKEKKFVSF